MLDRADFPRDKACGDGIAPHAVDVLAGLGVDAVPSDPPVRRLRLGFVTGLPVSREMQRPAYVVRRTQFDARLVAAARERGATVRRHQVRGIDIRADHVIVDGEPAGWWSAPTGRTGWSAGWPVSPDRATARSPSRSVATHRSTPTARASRSSRSGARLAGLRVVVPAGRRHGERRVRRGGHRRPQPAPGRVAGAAGPAAAGRGCARGGLASAPPAAVLGAAAPAGRTGPAGGRRVVTGEPADR